jgi:hypothetical protein
LHRGTFYYIYYKYCGHHTPIKSTTALLRVFAYFKVYPVSRTCLRLFQVSLGPIKRYVLHLSSCMNELQPIWNRRYVIDHLIS